MIQPAWIGVAEGLVQEGRQPDDRYRQEPIGAEADNLDPDHRPASEQAAV
ncbi:MULTISPECIES: hypothetical protein [Microvirga]|nr:MULTISPECIES: hypothetical protein [unclassified Microvirga]